MYGKLLNTLPCQTFNAHGRLGQLVVSRSQRLLRVRGAANPARAARQTGGGRADDGGQHLLYRRQLRGQGVRDQDWHARVGDAKKMCPGLLLVEATHAFYVRYHHMIVDVVESCVPVTGRSFDRSK